MLAAGRALLRAAFGLAGLLFADAKLRGSSHCQLHFSGISLRLCHFPLEPLHSRVAHIDPTDNSRLVETKWQADYFSC